MSQQSRTEIATEFLEWCAAGRVQEAFEPMLREAAAKPETRFAALLVLAQFAKNADNFETALVHVRAAAKDFPDREEPLLMALELLPRRPEAEALITAELQAHPDKQSLRLAYARAHPGPTLAYDYLRVPAAMKQYEQSHGQSPRDLAELAAALREVGVAPKFSTLSAGAWLDPWGRPFVHVAEKRLLGLAPWKIRLYSVGRNGVDEAGKGDDVAMDSALKRWFKRQLESAEIYLWLRDHAP